MTAAATTRPLPPEGSPLLRVGSPLSPWRRSRRARTRNQRPIDAGWILSDATTSAAPPASVLVRVGATAASSIAPYSNGNRTS